MRHTVYISQWTDELGNPNIATDVLSSKLLQVLKLLCFSLNSIYFQRSIYTWQHTSIQIHGKWIGKQVT